MAWSSRSLKPTLIRMLVSISPCHYIPDRDYYFSYSTHPRLQLCRSIHRHTALPYHIPRLLNSRFLPRSYSRFRRPDHHRHGLKHRLKAEAAPHFICLRAVKVVLAVSKPLKGGREGGDLGAVLLALTDTISYRVEVGCYGFLGVSLSSVCAKGARSERLDCCVQNVGF